MLMMRKFIFWNLSLGGYYDLLSNEYDKKFQQYIQRSFMVTVDMVGLYGIQNAEI